MNNDQNNNKVSVLGGKFEEAAVPAPNQAHVNQELKYPQVDRPHPDEPMQVFPG